MSGSDGHELATLLLLDPALQVGRSDPASRQAWAREDHVVELRSWRVPALGAGDEDGELEWANLVEALCGHVCLRAVFVGCGRRLADHTADEVADVLRVAVEEHRRRCPNGRPVRRRVVQL